MIWPGPLELFVFAGLFSPGPNVILLAASGARFGFAPSIPHILGVALGVGILAAVSALGIGILIAERPLLQQALTVIAAAWILTLAWRLWTAPDPDTDPDGRPFRFLEAVAFQAVNPKVWAVALSANAYVIDLEPVAAATRLGLTFSGLNLAVCTFWALAGAGMTAWLSRAGSWTLFFRIMAILLAISTVLIFL